MRDSVICGNRTEALVRIGSLRVRLLYRKPYAVGRYGDFAGDTDLIGDKDV